MIAEAITAMSGLTAVQRILLRFFIFHICIITFLLGRSQVYFCTKFKCSSLFLIIKYYGPLPVKEGRMCF